MKSARVRSRAPRRIGIACVLTGPPARASSTRRRFPFIPDANIHELIHSCIHPD